MRTVLAVMLFAACAPDSTTYPIGGGAGGGAGGNGGGGGGGSSGNGIDANPDVVEGLVCVLPDPRDFTTCLGSGAGGIAVTLGAGSAVTNDDGTFTIATPTGTNLVWSLSGSGVMASTIGFSTSAVIPAIQTMTFETLANENGIVFDPTQGTIIGQAMHAGSGFANATAIAAPVGIYDTFYASPTDPSDWLDAETTTTFGTFLIAGLTPGTETLTLTPGTGSAAIVNDVPSGSGVITFVSVAM
ncbi:MAG TPA: hypothetical protein VGG28_20040 [Kofleriaceae bacterium]|jgi:hypothetical protein